MRVFIAGVDGYLGWSLALYLAASGHEIAGGDLFVRRKLVEEAGSQSATPIGSIEKRLIAFEETILKELAFEKGDLREYNFIQEFFKLFQPEVMVHLGEMPSAPYSVVDVHHKLLSLGYKPTHDIKQELRIMLKDLSRYRQRIEEKKEALIPEIRWDGISGNQGS